MLGDVPGISENILFYKIIINQNAISSTILMKAFKEEKNRMDNAIIKNFVSENMKTFFAYALNRSSNQADAEELTSEIILAILGSADNLKDDNAIYGFVWAIANNTYKKFLSKKKKSIYVEMDETIAHKNEDICDLVLQDEEIKKLRRELTLLSKEYRICTVAYYFQHMGCKEIAENNHFSPEMVKYYLFKARKILKEGIDMERQYGEKSFNPVTFEFRVIFEKQANLDYMKLFNRKISGNILVSAYYTPVSVQELSLELGISTAYLEDELDLLERHGLILKNGKNKYQTNIIIFTENYANELIEKTKSVLEKGAQKIYSSMLKKIDRMKQVEFYGNDFTDNQLLWLGVIILLFHHTDDRKKLPYQELIPGCRGAAFGYDYRGALHEHYLDAYAGFSQISEDLYATFINLHALGNMKCKYKYDDKSELINMIHECKADFPVITKEAKLELLEILYSEVKMTTDLYDDIAEIAANLLIEHSPSKLAEKAKSYVHLELNNTFLGMLPDMMIQEKLLFVPENAHVGMYVNTDRQGVIDFYNILQGGGCKLV